MRRWHWFALAASHLAVFAGTALTGMKSARGVEEMFASMGRYVPNLAGDLAFGFAPGEQVRRLIEGEPPEPPEWAQAQEKVDLLRMVRLAVVAADSTERERLLSEAGGHCERDCSAALRCLLSRYAAKRLVPPGDDIDCSDCKVERRRLPPPGE
jgi:hypothetical protein